MGMRMPETCWAVFKRQAINLRNCCIWLVDLFDFFFFSLFILTCIYFCICLLSWFTLLSRLMTDLSFISHSDTGHADYGFRVLVTFCMQLNTPSSFSRAFILCPFYFNTSHQFTPLLNFGSVILDLMSFGCFLLV